MTHVSIESIRGVFAKIFGVESDPGLICRNKPVLFANDGNTVLAASPAKFGLGNLKLVEQFDELLGVVFRDGPNLIRPRSHRSMFVLAEIPFADGGRKWLGDRQSSG
jgi:hypothetical protein